MDSKPICMRGVGVVLVLALCISAASAQNCSLRVVGIGTVLVPTDTAIIGVSAQNNSDNDSLAAETSSKLLNIAEKSLIAVGVKKEEIMPDRSRGYATYHEVICNAVNNTTSCRDVVTNAATEQMTIKLKTSDRNETQRVIDAARSAGADAAIWGYALSDSRDAVDKAWKKALDDAKAKAEAYASSFGFSLGKAVEIEELTYPDIEIGTSWGWDMPGRWHRRSWIGPLPIWNGFFGENYIPEGMAEVTAYVGVSHELRSETLAEKD